MKKATRNNINVIPEFLSGFIYDCFGKKTTSEEQLEDAKDYFVFSNHPKATITLLTNWLEDFIKTT